MGKFRGMVKLEVQKNTGFIGLVAGGKFDATDPGPLVVQAAKKAQEHKLFVSAFVPDAKPSKVIEVETKSGGIFKATGFNAEALAEISKTHDPVVLVSFAGRIPLPYLAFFKKGTPEPASAKKGAKKGGMIDLND